ncbi:MAG TPA: helix-turn-helix domain-containing protein [Candidatus Thermoplasmatota archaeon]|nr:helix-turn-helix domain-containing protein [Candidatus Thermoplasmatota archaeon]
MTEADDLERVGLGRDEAAAWAALAREGPLTAPDIAARVGFARSRAYEVLRGLEERGLVEVLLGETRRYRAVALDRYVAGVLEAARDAERTARARLGRARALFPEREVVGAGGLGAVRVAEGRRAAHEAWARLLRAAKESALIVATGRATLRFLDTPEGSESYEAAKASGVAVRFVLLPGDEPEAAHRAAEILASDAEIAVHGDGAVTRVAVDGGRVAVVAHERDDERVYLGNDLLVEAESAALATDVQTEAARILEPAEPAFAFAGSVAAASRLLAGEIRAARAEILVLVGAGGASFAEGSEERRALLEASARGARVRVATAGPSDLLGLVEPALADLEGAIVIADGERIAEWYGGAGAPTLAFVARDPERARLVANRFDASRA